MEQQIGIEEFENQISLFEKKQEISPDMKHYFSNLLDQEWVKNNPELRRLIRLARYSCRIQKMKAFKKHIQQIKRYLEQVESL